MPCGAKLPVIALFSGAFFQDASWVGTMMYFVGIAIILVGALLVNRITGATGRRSYFIIELPEYKLPSVNRAVKSMLSRGWSYVVKAGTVILLCNAAVYIMQSFDWRLQLVEEGMAHTSILASIANPVGLLLMPIVGIAAWQLAAAAVTGFIAKENVVGTLAVCYGISNLIDTEALELLEGAGAAVADQFGITAVAALAYLVFNLFTPPCFAAIGAMNAEIKDKKWLFGGIGLQLGTGYSMGYLVYTVGTLITAPGTLDIPAAIGGGLFVAAFAGVLVALCLRSGKNVKTPCLAGGRR
jgi:ferrous iron transport protein B